MYTIQMTTEQQLQLERALMIHLLGVISALESHTITYQEADSLWFSSDVVTTLKRKAIKHDVIHILQQARELKHLYDLLPHAVPKHLNDLRYQVNQWLLKHKKHEITENIWH